MEGLNLQLRTLKRVEKKQSETMRRK